MTRYESVNPLWGCFQELIWRQSLPCTSDCHEIRSIFANQGSKDEDLSHINEWMCQIKQQFSPTRPRCWQITRTKSNLKMRDDGGRTEAAWCRSPLIPTCMILLGKFKLQYVTVSVSTLFCHFVATLLDRLLLQDFCWMWGRLWIKRWTMIMMT